MSDVMKYECFIKPFYAGRDIFAHSAAEARLIFVEELVDNICEDHIVANNLSTDDGNDPAPSVSAKGEECPR